MLRLHLAARYLLLSSIFAAACCAPALAQEETPAATPDPAAQPAQERVYTSEEVTKPAVILWKPDPVYHNYGAKLLDRSGTVKVSVVLSSTGRVTDVKVSEGLSQNQNLAASKAARRIAFIPAQKDGVPVSQSFVASYDFTLTTNESGKPEELKGLTKFYVDTGGDREALGELTAELQKRLPRLVLVDRPDEAECIIKFNSYRLKTMTETSTGRNGYPITVPSGRAWVFKQVGADKRHVLLYYVGVALKPFARGFVYEYKKANGMND